MSFEKTVVYLAYTSEFAQTLAEFLADLGNTVVRISGNEELREKLQAGNPKPDVLITSLASVDPGGLALLQQAHKQYPQMALLLIVNGGKYMGAMEAASCGVFAFLREPIRLNYVEYYLMRIQQTP